MIIHSFSDVKQSPEFFSAIVRFCLGLFLALYIWLGLSSGDFDIAIETFIIFSFVFFGTTFIFGVDLFRKPESDIRRYITLFFDLSCTTYSVFLTGGVGSEFILIYIWLYIAYGTRYGLAYLIAAVLIVLVEYNFVLFLDNAWEKYFLSSSAQLFILIIMPFYLNSILNKLRQSKQAAEFATQSKSKFLAHMSHEIRTPISSIIGAAHLLQKTPMTHEQEEYTNTLINSSKSLHALVDDILDFSKIEANKLELRDRMFDLQAMVNEVITILTPNAEYHDLELVLFIDPHLPNYVTGDKQRIKQVLLNLLGNAIKFTHKGSVSLLVGTDEQLEDKEKQLNLRFDIIDTGIGISQTQQEILFNSFTQVSQEGDSNYYGTGLGTTISKQLIELMGSQINITSDLGKGSHFWFNLSLPVAQSDQHHSEVKNSLKNTRLALLTCNRYHDTTLIAYCQYLGLNIDHFTSESDFFQSSQEFDLIIIAIDRTQPIPIEFAHKINQLSDTQSHIPKKVLLSNLSQWSEAQLIAGSLYDAYMNTPVTFPRFSNELIQLIKSSKQNEKEQHTLMDNLSLNVLIAEDEDINAMVLTAFLEELGHQTTRVMDGQQALEALKQDFYHIAFMDLRMPLMNGVDATKIWRQTEPEDQHTFIVALTANATSNEKEICLNTGMDEFLTKPITQDQLTQIISKVAPKAKQD